MKKLTKIEQLFVMTVIDAINRNIEPINFGGLKLLVTEINSKYFADNGIDANKLYLYIIETYFNLQLNYKV